MMRIKIYASFFNLKLHLKLLLLIFCLMEWYPSSSQNFTQITDPANPVVSDTGSSGGGSWIDINHDGWLDLFVSRGNESSENNALYLNEGNGVFKKIVTGSIVRDGGS